MDEKKLTYPPSDDGPLLIVAYASVGSGHRSAALAIAEAAALLRDSPTEAARAGASAPEKLRIETLDILDFGRIRFDGDKVASLFTGATRPVYDLTWRYSFTGRVLWGGGTGWTRAMFPAFAKYLARRKPAAVVCTHITAANAAAGARTLLKARFPIVCVPTDYEAEGLWPHLQTDLFCVADDRMAETLRARRVPEDRLAVTGLPCSLSFRVGQSPEERRKRRADLGIEEDEQLALVLAGAFLPRPYALFREVIEQALPRLGEIEKLRLVFVAGKDEGYAKALRSRCEQLGAKNASVFGYVEDMHALMAAADFAICKAGGLVVTECLCAQLPMILVGKTYGQEKANARMLSSAGAALHVSTPRELAGTAENLVKNPGSARAMLENAALLRKPDAATDIAATALELSRESKQDRATLGYRHFLHIYWGEKPAHTR